MTARAAGVLAAALVASASAAAAPEVAFTASRRDACVAPCAVFFDATATRDASAAHPFHDLDYRWDFGDERGEAWALSGLPKNRAIGGVAGHLFTQPGRYTVTLAVANARGETGRASAVVEVADPARALRTRCVSPSGRFDGCPDGAEQVKSGDLAASLANAPGRRTLLRRGERFSLARPLRLADASAGGAALGVFGPGDARATIAAAPGATIDPGDDWRLSHLELRGPGENRPLAAVTEHGGVRRLTLENVAVRGFNVCLELWSPARANEQVAAIDLSCAEFPDPGSGTKLFEDARESIFLGVDLDKGDPRAPGDQTEFAWRSVFTERKAIQHSRLRGRGAGQSKGLLQLRHCSANGPWRARCPDGAAPSRFVLVSDNHFEEGAGPSGLTAIRVCDHAACTGKPGESQPVTDYVFERNLIQIDPRAKPGDRLLSAFQLQAARTSVRHNVADLRGWPAGGGPRAFFALVEPLSNAARDPSGEVWIRRNTILLGERRPKQFAVCGERGGAPGLVCADNVIATGDRSDAVSAVLGSWRDAGNRITTANPFAATVPARGEATLRDLERFRLADGAAAGAAIEPR